MVGVVKQLIYLRTYLLSLLRQQIYLKPPLNQKRRETTNLEEIESQVVYNEFTKDPRSLDLQ